MMARIRKHKSVLKPIKWHGRTAKERRAAQSIDQSRNMKAWAEALKKEEADKASGESK